MAKTAAAAAWEARPSPAPGARRTGSTPVTGRGMATVMRFGACWVGIAEVEVVPSSGQVRVVKFTLGVDPGKIINPTHLRRNMEGGIMMGLGEALKEEVVFDRGKVTSNNWRRYPIPTMADMPEIRIVQTSRDDAGIRRRRRGSQHRAGAGHRSGGVRCDRRAAAPDAAHARVREAAPRAGLTAPGKSPAAFDRPCIPNHLGLRPKPPAAASGDPCAPRRVRRGAPCAPGGTTA